MYFLQRNKVAVTHEATNIYLTDMIAELHKYFTIL